MKSAISHFTALILILLMKGAIAQDFDPDFIRIDPSTGQPGLTQAGASHFARLALHCIQVEYPNKLSHVMNDGSEVKSPRALHPAFFGCFDWHSSVHGHWMLVRLLKLFPGMPEAAEIRKQLGENLTRANLLQEAAYLYQPGRKSFERTYGWAWLLKLAEELHTWDDPDGRQWLAYMAPVTDAIAERYLDFLPRQTYPIRTGVHPNTAFGMSFALDFARTAGHQELAGLLEGRARDYYFSDQSCPGSWEPGGADFLSPCLEEANLMARVLPEQEFRKWLNGFFPGLREGQPAALFSPAEVSDRTDPQIVHLDGLNLSRAWCLLRIAQALPVGAERERLVRTAREHLEATLPHIASGNYEGEHWLASFAVYSLSFMEER